MTSKRSKKQALRSSSSKLNSSKNSTNIDPLSSLLWEALPFGCSVTLQSIPATKNQKFLNGVDHCLRVTISDGRTTCSRTFILHTFLGSGLIGMLQSLSSDDCEKSSSIGDPMRSISRSLRGS